MAKYKKKPVLPIYTIAIVWVIYTLLHPLYQVSDYVSVILISVVVFIVAKGVFPTIEDGPAIPPDLVQHAHEHAHEHTHEHTHEHGDAGHTHHHHSSLHDIEHIVCGHLNIPDQVKQDVMAEPRLEFTA